jgi:peptidoglycan/LPS O-acetylase OafA/YrhL
LTKGGGFGVDAFFVLSGFLITAILLRDQTHGGRVRFGAFYRRRALRLLPALLVFLVVYVFYEWATNMPLAHEPSSAISIMFYYSNTWLEHGPISNGVGQMWSLAVEEQFYLLWPLFVALFFGLRRRFAPTVLLMVALIAAVTIRRAYLWDHGTPWIFLYTRLFTRADALLIGCLIAQLWVRGKLPKRGVQIAGWIALAYIAYIVRRGVSDSFLYRGGFTLIAVAFGVILIAVLQTDWAVNRVLRLPPLRAVGRVSYGLYIWHLAVFTAVLRYGRFWNPWVQAIVALGVTAAATLVSWTLVERPILRWKERLELADREQERERGRDDEKPAKKTKSGSRDASFRHVALPAPD